MPTAALFFDYPARFYLGKYYSKVGVENDAFMRSVADATRRLGSLGTVVELGGGPSLCAMFAMTAATESGPERVVWLDAGAPNLREVQSWLSGQPDAFDYSAILDWLEAELGASAQNVIERLRGARWDLRMIDLWAGLPADLDGVGDVVGSYFVAECATDCEAEFIELTKRVRQTSRDGAQVVLAYIRASSPYRLHDDTLYPALAVDECNLPSLLDLAGVSLANRAIRRGPIDEPPPRPGYSGMVFVQGQLTKCA